MHTETLPVAKKGIFQGRLRQICWLMVILFSAVFWLGMLVLIF